jgi:hypothetical protein
VLYGSSLPDSLTSPLFIPSLSQRPAQKLHHITVPAPLTLLNDQNQTYVFQKLQISREFSYSSSVVILPAIHGSHWRDNSSQFPRKVSPDLPPPCVNPSFTSPQQLSRNQGSSQKPNIANSSSSPHPPHQPTQAAPFPLVPAAITGVSPISILERMGLSFARYSGPLR